MSKHGRAVICPYCNQPAKHFADSRDFYRGMNYGPVWACRPCDALVGCHKGGTGTTPLGRLANKELRQAKIAAHASFDVLWQRKIARDGCSKNAARSAAYRWLSGALGLPAKKTHIGMFDVEQCRRVVEVCSPFVKRRAA